MEVKSVSNSDALASLPPHVHESVHPLGPSAQIHEQRTTTGGARRSEERGKERKDPPAPLFPHAHLPPVGAAFSFSARAHVHSPAGRFSTVSSALRSTSRCAPRQEPPRTPRELTAEPGSRTTAAPGTLAPVLRRGARTVAVLRGLFAAGAGSLAGAGAGVGGTAAAGGGDGGGGGGHVGFVDNGGGSGLLELLELIYEWGGAVW